MIGASNVYEPKGMVFWSQGKTLMLVSGEEPRESLRGWLLYRHPDGQWVTSHKATDADVEAIYSARVENGRVVVQFSRQVDPEPYNIDDPYIAHLRYKRWPASSIELEICSPDAEGAFKVYRQNVQG